MQMRSRTYLQFISLWRAFRHWILPQHVHAPAETSPFLIYVAVVLALLLAILEIDVHRGELASLGLLTTYVPIDAAFLGP